MAQNAVMNTFVHLNAVYTYVYAYLSLCLFLIYIYRVSVSKVPEIKSI